MGETQIGLADTWDNKIFATRINSEFANRPVLHIVFVDLWGTGRLANSEFVLATNVFLCVRILEAPENYIK